MLFFCKKILRVSVDNKLSMKLKNLLHIQESDIHLIGSLTPPFFFRVSEIMEEFVRLCDNNSIEESLNLLKVKYSPTEFEDFQQRLEKIKDKLFVNDDYKEANEIDFSSKVHILTWKIQRALPPHAKTNLTPENYLFLTPKYPGRRGHFYFSLFIFTYLHFSHTLTGQFNLMRRVDDAVKDGISDCWVTDCIVPVCNR